MGKDSKISWCDATWQVVAGCTPVSPGCKHCYSARLCATRFAHLPWAKGLAKTVVEPSYDRSYRWTGEVVCRADQLDVPLHWRAGKRIFVGDRGDMFHEKVPDEFIAAVMGVAGACPQHTFLFLTKRPRRIGEWFEWLASLAKCRALNRFADEPKDVSWRHYACVEIAHSIMSNSGLRPHYDILSCWLPPNAWLGTSVCAKSDLANIDHLRLVPAAKRFLSIEPLIEDLGPLDLTGIDWVICGGESGPGARPMHPDWVRSIRDQCVKAGVPFFFKQWGQWAPLTGGQGFHGKTVWRMRSVGAKVAGRVLDGRTWEEGPQ
jgi:protein gp37